MAEFILFAILSAFVGIYTLFPSYRQSRIQFSIGPIGKCLGVLGLLVVFFAFLVISFIVDGDSFIRRPAWLVVDSVQLGQIHLGVRFLAEATQITIVLIISGYLIYVLSSPSSKIDSWNEFGMIVREFRDRSLHSELADLLNDHYEKLFHDNSDMPEEVGGIVEEAVLNRNFIESSASSRPEFILRILTDSNVAIVDREHLADIFIRHLIVNTDSLLYSEIRNLEKLQGYALDRIPERYRVLSNLFEDCSIEDDLSIARSIGEPTIDYIRQLPDGVEDPYNKRDTRFTTSPLDAIPSVYEDRIYICIEWYNIAVREALHQDHQGHMWMYYYYWLVREICNNYEQVPQSERTDEWDSDYQYLISKMVDNIVRWIAVPEFHWYNGTFSLTTNRKGVIQSAIDLLFQVHEEILNCDNIPPGYKRRISEKIIDTYFDLNMSHNSDSLKIGSMMKAHIAGVTSGDDQDTIDYRRQFSSHLSSAEIDQLYYSRGDDARDIRDELQQTIL